MRYALDDLVPEIAPSAWIAPDARVMGAVRMAEEASVWWQAVLRGDCEPLVIGPRSNVQDGCVLHADPGFPLTIGADVTVGHQAMLHGCTVGDGSLVGIGAIVLNGAVIGRGCLIGAGALIPEGKVIEDGALVIGSPGRVKRMLSEDELAGLLGSAAHYVANAKRFRGGLRALD
jgi:carbonic anhydrase/acetyltransferase-like protein (isoleucine patch superfamily)